MKTFSSQKRLAAKVLEVGQNKVWFDPLRLNDIQEALTCADIEELIKDNAIKAKPSNYKKKPTKKKRKGTSHIKKKINTRKQDYIKKIRKLRKYISNLREANKIDREEYYSLRKKARSGLFRNLRHMRDYVISAKTKIGSEKVSETKKKIKKRKVSRKKK